MESERRKGDKIAIEGGYQHRALLHGNVFQRAWHHLKLQSAVALAALKDGERILDPGCGSGILTHYLPATIGEYTGIDANSAAVAFARATYATDKVRFEQLQVDELHTLPANHYSCIFFLEIIEHITPQQGAEVLALFHQLLEQGGRCVISTPNRRSLWPAIEWALDFFKLVPTLKGEQHEHLYSLAELAAAGRKAGFRIKELRTMNGLAPWLAFVGSKVTERMNQWELRSRILPGSLMLAVLEKE